MKMMEQQLAFGCLHPPWKNGPHWSFEFSTTRNLEHLTLFLGLVVEVEEVGKV